MNRVSHLENSVETMNAVGLIHKRACLPLGGESKVDANATSSLGPEKSHSISNYSVLRYLSSSLSLSSQLLHLAI